MFFDLKGNRTLGREESREGYLLGNLDFCKLHIISHYVAVFLRPGAGTRASFKVVPLGKIGSDNTGESLVGMMHKVGMDTSFVTRDKWATTLFSVCFQYPDSSGGNITTAASASSRLTPDEIRKAEPVFNAYRGQGIAVAAPEVPLETRLALLELATEYGFLRFCALNSAEIVQLSAADFFKHTDVLALNRDEAESLLQARLDPGKPRSFLKLLEKKLISYNPGIRISLTMGSAGSYGFERGAWEFTPSAEVKAKSTAGAGDASLAGLIISAACGFPFILPKRKKRKSLAQAPLETALDFAALLASLSVMSTDTINLEANRKTLCEHGKKLGLTYSDRTARLLELD